ncbi:exodeoxyribonuclease-3 [Methylohalomonas lacus]|uniref:Exodeoxyribonuclease-3 n=1 Tax=Methylohalomonas lacus TaxID=398773 RepID=A0AAE3HLE0_9GAMM|nr:exodeoxyribonuclease III [Methylohalomonas lacus]MCS3903269.1 exodeoxyribonuclease-3 [Methylohalomonas lacus]
MRVMTLNANGIRAAHRKGFFDWLPQQGADVVCIQETKAQVHQLVDDIRQPDGYYGYFRDAQKPGYSGVALYCRRQPDKVHDTLGWPRADDEGRYIRADFGKLSVISLYLPSGTTGDVRQDIKYECLDYFMDLFRRMRRQKREFIICGDWNIAHTKNDIRNWRSNQKNSGFLPEERAWLDKLFDRVGYVDAFRRVNQSADEYTWWSNRGQAWSKNVGWRIDYQIVSPGLQDAIRDASIYREARFSDHAPLTIDYEVDW